MARLPFWDPAGGYSGPLYSPNPYDFVIFNGTLKTPGTCYVQTSPGKDVDRKKPAGGNGGKATHHGLKLADVDLHFTIWTAEQWNAWQDIVEVIWPNVDKATDTIFTISHPWLQLYRIAAVTIIGVRSPPKSEPGSAMQFDVKCLQSKLPGKKTATVTPLVPDVQVVPQFQGHIPVTPANAQKTPPGARGGGDP